MIEIDLVAHLKADATLTNLVSGRIYPLTAPQNVVKPYIFLIYSTTNALIVVSIYYLVSNKNHSDYAPPFRC